MIGADGKKILPVYGDMRPVEVRKNNVRMTGWIPSVKSGESVEFENTYNHEAEVLVSGKSEQVQTVQGKNLLDEPKKIEDFATSYHPVSVIDNGIFVTLEGTNNYTYYTTKNIIIKPDTYYTFAVDGYGDSGIYKKFEIRVRNDDGSVTAISGITLGSSRSVKNTVFKTPVSAVYLYIFYYVTADNVAGKMYIYSVQLEEGPTATPYEPFVPNSPSPDYPSPVNSAGDCNLVSRTLNLVEKDIFKTGWYIYNGGMSLHYDDGILTATLINTKSVQRVTKSGFGSIFTFNHKYYISCDIYTNVVSGSFSAAFYSSVYSGKNIISNDWGKYTGFLTNNPATNPGLFLLGLADVVGSVGDIIKFKKLFIVDLTAEFGAGNEPTKEECDLLFAKWQDKKSMQSALPIIRKIEDVADTYNPVTGEYVQRIGKWTQIGGGDAIITDALSNSPYLCTHKSAGLLTGQSISVDTTDNYEVYYQLATPVITYLAPATVPTYYPYTLIEQDGAVKGTIEATVKVME